MLSSELESVMHLMSDYPAQWAVCGGWALDLFLNRVTRSHKDIDLSILRKDQALIQAHMNGWTLEIAHQGQMFPWKNGQIIELPMHTIWCRHPNHDPDFVEFLLDEADNTHYRFRHNPAIKAEFNQAFLTSPSGVPILAPEIVLLYKAKRPQVENTPTDFAHILPHLSNHQCEWLHSGLQQQHGTHPWLHTLESISQ